MTRRPFRPSPMSLATLHMDYYNMFYIRLPLTLLEILNVVAWAIKGLLPVSFTVSKCNSGVDYYPKILYGIDSDYLRHHLFQ